MSRFFSTRDGGEYTLYLAGKRVKTVKGMFRNLTEAQQSELEALFDDEDRHDIRRMLNCVDSEEANRIFLARMRESQKFQQGLKQGASPFEQAATLRKAALASEGVAGDSGEMLTTEPVIVDETVEGTVEPKPPASPLKLNVQLGK